MTLSLGLIYADIKMAEYALNNYKDSPKNKDIKNMCAFHIQQAAEKLIKYQIYQSISNPNNKDIYTHNIGVLLQFAAREKLTLTVPDYIVKNAAIITAWEAGNRYDLHFSIRIDTLEKALNIVKTWYSDVKKNR